jgi:hypothetical protein
MIEVDRRRRRFLTSTALTGLGLVSVVRAAGAFTGRKMTAEEHKAYLNACTGAADPYHAQLVEAAAADLKDRMSAAEIEQAVAAMRCPICGCALVAVAPQGGAAKAG